MSDPTTPPPAAETPTHTPDKYDAAISFLTAHPSEIEDAWRCCEVHPAGCLFLFLSPDGTSRLGMGRNCGCPTQVRGGCLAWTDELTELVAADERIPKDGILITVESLPAFAEIQRLADRTIRNAAPTANTLQL